MSKEEKKQPEPEEPAVFGAGEPDEQAEGEEEATNPEKERVEQERKLSEPDEDDGDAAEGDEE
jgi:hypothetical protein